MAVVPIRIEDLTPEQRAAYLSRLGAAPVTTASPAPSPAPAPTPNPGTPGTTPGEAGAGIPKINFSDLVKKYADLIQAQPNNVDALKQQMLTEAQSRVKAWQDALGQWAEGHKQGQRDANKNGIPDALEDRPRVDAMGQIIKHDAMKDFLDYRLDGGGGRLDYVDSRDFRQFRRDDDDGGLLDDDQRPRPRDRDEHRDPPPFGSGNRQSIQTGFSGSGQGLRLPGMNLSRSSLSMPGMSMSSPAKAALGRAKLQLLGQRRAGG